MDPSNANIADDGPTEWSTGSLTVTLNVTDNNALSGTDPVQIQLWNPSDSLLLDWTSLSTFGGTGYRYIWWVGGNPIGTGYYYRIRINDTSNNIVITSNYNEKFVIYIRAKNSGAIAFYKNLGFTQKGILARQVKIDGQNEDEIFMELFL